MLFVCEEFQVFHFGVIFKFFFKKNHVQVFFSFFITLLKFFYYAHMVSRQMNMKNMRRQTYGLWKPPPHMFFTIVGA